MDLSDLALLSLASTTRPEDNTSSDSDVKKVKKRRVSKACIPCNHAHVSCEKARPCKRCVERGHPDQCIDKETKRRGRKAGSPPTVQPTLPPTHDPTISPLEISPNAFPSPLIQFTATPTNSDIPPISTPTSLTDPSAFPNLNPGSLDFLLETYWQGLSFDTQIEASIMSPALEQNMQNINPDLFEKENVMLTKFVAMFREKLNLPGIEIDSILLEFSQERARIWKYIAENTKNVSSHDTYILTIMHGFKDEITTTIEKYRQLFEPLASPTILWDRTGQIHYVNPAYKAITGFHYPLPTEKYEFAIYKHIFSPETLLEYCLTELATMREYPNIDRLNAYTMKCAVRVHTELAEKYISGTMALNIKKDSFGVPYLYVGTFFPSEFPKWVFRESHKDLCI